MTPFSGLSQWNYGDAIKRKRDMKGRMALGRLGVEFLRHCIWGMVATLFL